MECLGSRVAEYYDIIKKLFEKLCARIGPKCWETLEKLARGEISVKEAFEIIKREGIAKGVSDEDIDRIIAEVMQ